MHTLTCTKEYTDIPFAHRQPNHDGHCAFIHGHNWGIKVTFGAKELDENNFVIDFGKLKFLKQWIDTNLDHACLLNADDPFVRDSKPMDKYFKIFIVPDCSCEGLACYVFTKFSALVEEATNGRVFVRSITVTEDAKNSATYGY